ncbi:FAD dependent oxidoreductase [Hyphomonas adhaerens MHS-3]|uniref:FAD dependent oxidoreductase n=1 Tax=Hyphomonas adhaerens MHS-3 TaxID=1280949 RepID=A0A069E858_9PROT|nr:NAD(P)/FAD-dependent oxidoreductase [Hyphomonas adhaerens]KCZ86272.1 FAD dependent oxidoreductase [Hyphomonas adhaerens MHS-3]
MIETEAIVIGAGAVGLACAAALARAGNETLVLESALGIGTGTSARNSEVIHAGLYYPTGSLRHRMCVAGRRQLYQWMEERGVPYRKTGKLIVGTSDTQIPRMRSLFDQGTRNGVEGLHFLTGPDAMALEPNLTCTAAVLSEETGILDSHAYMLSLQGDLEDHGGSVVVGAPVETAEILPDGRFCLNVGGAEPTSIITRTLVNSAGLHAVRIAKQMDGYPPDLIPFFTLAKGNYFSCQAKTAFERLIYPAPVEGGLGVHVTLDLGGRMRLGPDVEWLGHDNPDQIDYTVDLHRAAEFYDAVRQYWPGLPDGAIAADYSGCRPKLSAPGDPAADFRIDGPEFHGHAGLVHLFGIESPGLTSSLAIAEDVACRLSRHT